MEEASTSLDVRDVHAFLQRLPAIFPFDLQTVDDVAQGIADLPLKQTRQWSFNVVLGERVGHLDIRVTKVDVDTVDFHFSTGICGIAAGIQQEISAFANQRGR